VLVDTNGKVKLADFGYQLFVQILLSKIAPDKTYYKKDFWIAPENLKGFGSLEYLSDIWSIGCLAYELCTGNPPFVDQIGWDEVKLRELHMNKGKLRSARTAEVPSRHFLRVSGLYEDLPGLRITEQAISYAASEPSLHH
jgi:serine/threonine protein kinase